MMNRNNKTRTRGFTLIELLVVISIIGMLSSIVLASVNSARAKAYNAARLEKIKQWEIAFELYKMDKGGYYLPGSKDEYPYICLGGDACKASIGDDVEQNIGFITAMDDYISQSDSNDSNYTIVGNNVEWKGVIYHCLHDQGDWDKNVCKQIVLFYVLEKSNGCVLSSASDFTYYSELEVTPLGDINTPNIGCFIIKD